MKTISIRLETEGGISGRGLGSVSVTGDRVAASDVRRNCEGALARAEQEQLDALLRSAHPERWRESYAAPDRPHGSPDQIRYVLTAGGHSTSWFGENPDGLPEELRAIRAALWNVRDRVLRQCP